MIWTIVIILLILWIFGIMLKVTLGGLLHLILLLVIILALVDILRRRKGSTKI